PPVRAASAADLSVDAPAVSPAAPAAAASCRSLCRRSRCKPRSPAAAAAASSRHSLKPGVRERRERNQNKAPTWPRPPHGPAAYRCSPLALASNHAAGGADPAPCASDTLDPDCCFSHQPALVGPPGGMRGAGASFPGSPAGAAGTLRRSQRARAPSRRSRDSPQSARGMRRSPSGAPPVRVRSIIVPLHGARAGRNPPAEERGEASPHPAPSPSLGRRAAVRSRAVGRPGDVPAGGSARRRDTMGAACAGKRSRRQSAGARRRSRGKGGRRRSSGSGRAARARREPSESSDSGDNWDGSSAAETAAEVPGTSEEPSSADETAEGCGGAAGGPAGPSQPCESTSTFNLQAVARVGGNGGKRKRGVAEESRKLDEMLACLRQLVGARGVDSGSPVAAWMGMNNERPPGLVWIVGHSYVYWGAQLANRRREGRQLGIGSPGQMDRCAWYAVG
ncbi:hypothetical protein PRIEUP_LOCUS6731, partial [Pristimantis euphronides]